MKVFQSEKALEYRRFALVVCFVLICDALGQSELSYKLRSMGTNHFCGDMMAM